MRRKAFLEIGKIITTHGVRGFLKIECWCDDVCIFKSLNHVYLDEKGEKKFEIKEVKFIKNFALLLLREVGSIEETEKFINKIIFAKREDLKINENEYFIQDLIGIKMFDYFKKTKCYGEILDVIKIRNNNLYLVRDEKNREIMIPNTDEIIKEKKLEEGKIYVKLIEGLLEF